MALSQMAPDLEQFMPVKKPLKFVCLAALSALLLFAFITNVGSLKRSQTWEYKIPVASLGEAVRLFVGTGMRLA